MKTAVEWLLNEFQEAHKDFGGLDLQWLNKFEQAKEMEKQQIIDAGNSCALEQHIHEDRINKMSLIEVMQYSDNIKITLGEQYYNETFKK